VASKWVQADSGLSALGMSRRAPAFGTGGAAGYSGASGGAVGLREPELWSGKAGGWSG
jgi:hypothetical protein